MTTLFDQPNFSEQTMSSNSFKKLLEPSSYQTTQAAIDLVKGGKFNEYESCLSYAKEFIKLRNEFTSEDIIESYQGVTPKEKRVWGAILRELKKLGLIEKTDKVSVYRGKQGHGKPVNVWRRK